MLVIVVTEVDAAETHALRRRVLRPDPALAVAYPDDERPGAFSLGARPRPDGPSADTAAPPLVGVAAPPLVGVAAPPLVGVASFSPMATPHRPGWRAYRLRAMATDPTWSGRGVGRAVLEAGLARVREAGAEVLWADARDSALGFYRHLGFEVVGPGFVHAETGLPHHVVLCELSAR